MSTFEFQDWGLIDYQKAWDKQKELVNSIQKGSQKSTLVFCEHPSVITVGKNGSEDNLLKSREFLEDHNVQLIWNNRGGDVTIHNPRQLVAYPIFDLKNFKQDLHWFLRSLEEAIINTIAEFGLIGGRVEEYTGVWLESERKICAMGLHCSRWVTSHGLALNVNNDLNEFKYIVPCGIKEKEVTSISKEVGTAIDINYTKDLLKSKLNEIF